MCRQAHIPVLVLPSDLSESVLHVHTEVHAHARTPLYAFAVTTRPSCALARTYTHTHILVHCATRTRALALSVSLLPPAMLIGPILPRPRLRTLRFGREGASLFYVLYLVLHHLDVFGRSIPLPESAKPSCFRSNVTFHSGSENVTLKFLILEKVEALNWVE